MDFSDTPEEAAYRRAARAWLAANAAPRRRGDNGAMPHVTAEGLALAKAWQARKAEAGYAAITYPPRYGGGGRTALEELIYLEEEAQFHTPRGIFEISLGNCVPTVMAFADDEARERLIPPAVRGEEVWCQLFSEPEAGSDLAALRTRAQARGTDWVVSGQKLWTSGAHFADYGLLLARTDFDAPKHRGLTMFYLRMDSPGIEHRPIRQLDGSAEFNEVFFADVIVPDAQRLGGVGEGWRVAMATLGFERGSVGGGLRLLDGAGLVDVARGATIDGWPAEGAAHFEEQLVDVYLNVEGLRLNYLRAMTELSRLGIPGPEYAIGKLVAARTGQRAAYAALAVIGEAGMLAAEELGDSWRLSERSWSWGAALRIAGGSEEILKTLVAERVLGLPPEPRFDKNTPFRELAT